MSEVHQVIIEIKRPKKDFPGRVAYGFFVVKDGVVVMTDADGKEAGADETGKKWRHTLRPGEDPRSVASRMTRELRLALRPGGRAVVNGFDGPLTYQPLKY